MWQETIKGFQDAQTGVQGEEVGVKARQQVFSVETPEWSPN